MPNKSNHKLKSLCGEVCLEIIVMPGADDEMEIQNIHDISIMIGSGVGKTIHVGLDDFRNQYGSTVADVIMGQEGKLYNLILEQDKAEREQEEQDRAADVVGEFWG